MRIYFFLWIMVINGEPKISKIMDENLLYDVTITFVCRVTTNLWNRLQIYEPNDMKLWEKYNTMKTKLWILGAFCCIIHWNKNGKVSQNFVALIIILWYTWRLEYKWFIWKVQTIQTNVHQMNHKMHGTIKPCRKFSHMKKRNEAQPLEAFQQVILTGCRWTTP